MLILYLLFFSFLFLLNYKKHGFTPSTFIIGIYLFSSVMSLLLLYHYEAFDEEKISLTAIIFHIICLYLFLSPVIYFGNTNINEIKFPPYGLLRYLVWSIILLSLTSIVVSWSKLKVVFAFEELSEARRLHNARELYEEGGDIYTYLGGIGHHLSIFAMFFFFYFVAYYPQKKITQLLLFLSSFAIVFSNLSIAGRDGIVRWAFFLIFFFSFFKKNISAKVKKYIYTLSLMAGIPIISIFIAITQSRFGEKGGDVLLSVASYIGQSFPIFSYNFNQFMDGTAGGRINFPFLFPASQRASMNNLNDYFYADYNLNTFPTFVGSFYLDLGLLKTLLLALLFYLIFTYYYKFHKPRASFVKIISFIILYQIMLLGIFYYMFYSSTVTNTLFLLIVLSVFLQYKSASYERSFLIK